MIDSGVLHSKVPRVLFIVAITVAGCSSSGVRVSLFDGGGGVGGKQGGENGGATGDTGGPGGTLHTGGASAIGCGSVNLQTDNNNCGECGSICSAISPSTAECTAGRCLVSLASGQSDPGEIVVDLSNVYWANGTGPMRISLGGGTPTTLASGQYGSLGIAVDAESVYWINQFVDTVMKVSLGGGTPTTLASEQYTAGSIAVNARGSIGLTRASAR